MLTREEILRNTTCGDCLNFMRAPSAWTNREFGFCTEDYEWMEADETLWRSGCDWFEARPGFEPQPDYDWKDGIHDWD